MRRRTDTSFVAYLAALALTLSTIESSLPHAIPFLRLGLANLALLWALDRLSARDYLLLAALKWVTSSLMSGLLFSPYAIVSLAGTAASALVMLASHRLLGRWSTLWSHSTLGSIASGVSQLAASSLFLTDTVLRLMPLMLAFNIVSGIVIAALAYVFEPARQVEFEDGCQEKPASWLTLLPPALRLLHRLDHHGHTVQPSLAFRQSAVLLRDRRCAGGWYRKSPETVVSRRPQPGHRGPAGSDERNHGEVACSLWTTVLRLRRDRWRPPDQDRGHACSGRFPLHSCRKRGSLDTEDRHGMHASYRAVGDIESDMRGNSY